MEPRLSIVVPVYNEERTLASLIDKLLAACGEIAQVVYVDDGSKDGSLAILHRKARPRDVVLHKENGGKGSAVRAGYAKAEGTYVVVQDADLEYDPSEIPSLLAVAEAGSLPAVFGSRRLKKQKQYAHFTFFIGGSLLTYLCNLLYGTDLSDQPTCYKMVRRDRLLRYKLREDDFRFDPELTVMLARDGVAIREVPISYHPRTKAEGKKINWKDWFRWVWVFLRLRVVPRSTLYRS